jgi:two-component sensor histidine kinase
MESIMTRSTVAHPADLEELTLVRELTYRINTQLASAIDTVTAAAVRADTLEAKVALGNVAELLREQANVHRVLEIPEGNALVDAAQHLRSLCSATTRSCLEPIGIHLSFQADTLPLEPERCWRLGMAVYELIMNAARHACFDGRAGEIKIKVSLASGGQLHRCGQRDALGAVETGAGSQPRSRFGEELGRPARLWLSRRILLVSFRISAHRTRAAGQQGSRYTPRSDAASTEDDSIRSPIRFRHNSPRIPQALRRVCMSRRWSGAALLANRAPSHGPSRSVHSSNRSRSREFENLA